MLRILITILVLILIVLSGCSGEVNEPDRKKMFEGEELPLALEKSFVEYLEIGTNPNYEHSDIEPLLSSDEATQDAYLELLEEPLDKIRTSNKQVFLFENGSARPIVIQSVRYVDKLGISGSDGHKSYLLEGNISTIEYKASHITLGVTFMLEGDTWKFVLG